MKNVRGGEASFNALTAAVAEAEKDINAARAADVN
jgi:hypothetical protein